MGFLSFVEARHLLARAEIGVEWHRAKQFEGISVAQALDKLLNVAAHQPPPPPYFTPWTQFGKVLCSGL